MRQLEPICFNKIGIDAYIHTHTHTHRDKSHEKCAKKKRNFLPQSKKKKGIRRIETQTSYFTATFEFMFCQR